MGVLGLFFQFQAKTIGIFQITQKKIRLLLSAKANSWLRLAYYHRLPTEKNLASALNSNLTFS